MSLKYGFVGFFFSFCQRKLSTQSTGKSFLFIQHIQKWNYYTALFFTISKSILTSRCILNLLGVLNCTLNNTDKYIRSYLLPAIDKTAQYMKHRLNRVTKREEKLLGNSNKYMKAIRPLVKWAEICLLSQKLFSFPCPTNFTAIVFEGSIVWVKVTDCQEATEKRQRWREFYMSVRLDPLWKHRSIDICRSTNRHVIYYGHTGTIHLVPEFKQTFFLSSSISVILTVLILIT